MKHPVVAACLVLALAGVLAGCGSVAASGGNPLPGPGDGAGSSVPPRTVQGNIIISAPTLELRTQRPDEAQPDATGALQLPADFAIFPPLDTNYTQSVQWPPGHSDTPVVQTVPHAAAERYILPFTFADLPAGQYRAGFYRVLYGDWDIPNTLTILNEFQAWLVSDRPGVAHDYTFGQEGDTAGTAVSGELLCSGNAASYPFTLSLRPSTMEQWDPDFAKITAVPRWSFQPGPALYGRYFFTMQWIKSGAYIMDWASYPGQWKDGLWTEADSDPARAPDLALTLAPGATLANQRAYRFRLEYAADVVRDKGILQVELHLDPGKLDWSKDTLLVAEAQPARDGINFVAWNYLAPQHFRQGVAYYRLTPLQDASYRLRLLQLGPTNADPPVELARSSKSFDVVYPHSDPIPDEIWEPYDPYGEAVWTPNLPAGP